MSQADYEILRGELSHVALEEIIAAIGQERVKGRLLLSQGFRLVSAYFEDGELVHVGADGDQCLEELLCAFTWTSGNFVLELEAEAPAHTQRVGSAELILQGMRLRDGSNTIAKNLSLRDAILWLPTTGDRAHGSISLSPAEARVLELVDCRRTLAEIARASGLGDALTTHVLTRLLAAGLVTTNPPRGRCLQSGDSRMTIVRRRATWRVVLGSLSPFAVLGSVARPGDLVFQVLEALESPVSIHELCDLLGCSVEQVGMAIDQLAEAGLVSCTVVRRTCEGLKPSPA
ncbi:MAG: DUF4388 domain-containing protein [Chloroflexi bacterium]|nr:DUF4388 domain-containing protein [Chloroflexota bacterium]